MATSWEDVKRLAADFQRAQLSSTVQRLSERNCIEIVKKLVSLKLVDVIFTTSGKEYITPQHLQKEIRDELTIAGGRISLSTLASALQVDLSHIEAAVAEILKTEKDVKLVLDQLISDTYLNTMAEEVNERLQQQGEVVFADVVKSYDVPTEFLRAAILSRLGGIIKGQTDDKEIFYTEAFVTMHRYRVRGALSAVTKPVQLSTLRKNFALPHRITVSLVEQLISQRKLSGSLSGHDERAFYAPEIYSRAQQNWIANAFYQNGFLEYDALTRLGITDSKSYTKKFLQAQDVLYLSSVCVGRQLLNQVESAIEEAVLTGSWVDVASMLPTQFEKPDVAEAISHVVTPNKSLKRYQMHVIDDTIVVSDALIESCLKTFEPAIKLKAEEDLQSGKLACFFDDREKQLATKNIAERKKSRPQEVDEHDKKEERRRKAAGGKSGGGTQGRETKTKSTKKKYGKTKKSADDFDDDSEDEAISTKGGRQHSSGHSTTTKREMFVFMTLSEISESLMTLELLQDSPDHLSQGIAELIYHQLNHQFKTVSNTLFKSSLSASASQRRKTHAELQERITLSLTQITLYSSGLESFTGDLKAQLVKHLLRSVCTDLANSVLLYLAAENDIPVASDSLNVDQRLKIINKLGTVQKEALLKVHQALAGADVEEFISAMNVACGGGILDMMIRIDRKKDRHTITAHRQATLEQLSQATDSVLALHLSVLALAQIQLQKMILFSGKFVPQIIAFLKGVVPDDLHSMLISAQDLVMKTLVMDDSNDKAEVVAELQMIIEKIKREVVDYKRKASLE